MKVYGYRVAMDEKKQGASLSEVLDYVIELSFDKRNKLRTGDKIRIEEIKCEKDKKGDVFCYLIDFIRIRMNHGPAKGGLTSAVTDFELKENEGFCEETAVVYYPKDKLLIAQYNHNSVTHAAIRDYLGLINHENPSEFIFNEILRKDVQDMLDNSDLMTQLEIKVDVEKITDQDMKEGKPLEMVTTAKEFNTRHLSIVLGGSKKVPLYKKPARQFANWVMKKITTDPSAILMAKARVGSQSHDETHMEVLNLLNAKKCFEVELLPDKSKRVPREQRWNALRNLYKEFK